MHRLRAALAAGLGVIACAAVWSVAGDILPAPAPAPADAHPLTVAAKAIAEIAGPAGGLVLLALWCGWLLVVRRRPARAAAVFTIVLVGWNISEIAKIIVARHRPPTVWSLAPETGSNSFPSGHTAFTTACVLAACVLAGRSRHRDAQPCQLGRVWLRRRGGHSRSELFSQQAAELARRVRVHSGCPHADLVDADVHWVTYLMSSWPGRTTICRFSSSRRAAASTCRMPMRVPCARARNAAAWMRLKPTTARPPMTA